MRFAEEWRMMLEELQILILSRNGQRFDYWKRKSKESGFSWIEYDLNRLCWPMELSWMVWFIWWKQFGGGRAGEVLRMELLKI
jgi:hypothetical protein